MHYTYIIEGPEPQHVINAKKYLEKADETNCLGVEISKYRKAINTILSENKRIEQNERIISDEMEEIEYCIDSLFPPKPLWVQGYGTYNPEEMKWCNGMDQDKQFLEIYDFYDDINNFHSNELIHEMLTKPHELRHKFDTSEGYINQYDEMLLKNIKVDIIGDNYCTCSHDIWGKIYVPKEIASYFGLYEGNTDNFQAIVKYTNNNIPWRIPDFNEAFTVFAGKTLYNNDNNDNDNDNNVTDELVMKSNQLYCNTNMYCRFSNK